MYYKVSLINNSIDNSTAEIVPYNSPDGVNVTVSVYSDNEKMRSHLESIVFTEAYVLAPGKYGPGFHADGVLHLYPNTVDYVQMLPEILSWKGYNCVFVEEAHKSLSMLDINYLVLKSSSSEQIYTNTQGQRIVQRVPQGYVAVHSDGRTVAAGGWVNANIDKEDAEWTLVDNPYESYGAEQRDQEKAYMDMFIQDYHPGAENELYSHRTENSGDFFQTDYKPQGGRKFSEFYTAPEQPAAPAQPAPAISGKILYSPSTGQAVMSDNWPFPGSENTTWYVFDSIGLSDDEKRVYADLTGLTPQLIQGLDSGQVVQAATGLDTSSGAVFGAKSYGDTGDLTINPSPPGRLSLDTVKGESYRKAYEIANTRLQAIRALTSVRDETGSLRISDKLEGMQIDGLRGAEANFVMELHPHQKAGVMSLVEESQYEVYGGPQGHHGQFLSFSYGTGKTAMVMAADAVMRNRGRFKAGEQVTIITAPNKNVYVWQQEVGKFRDEDAIVVDGDRAERVKQWEDLVGRAQSGTLPNIIVVGSSKFRFSSADGETDDDWELGVDAKYMKLLALGGSLRGLPVQGKHISALVLDESGQYVNPGSARHSAVQEIADSIYHGRGIVWSLNGDVSGNSASDTISEISFLNKMVRDNYMTMVNMYTKVNYDAPRVTKDIGRRIWKDAKRMYEFASAFRPQIYTLDATTIAGEDYGLSRTIDLGAELGRNWGSVYMAAIRKLEAGIESKNLKKSFGLQNILIQASLGAVSPARMIEYDVGVNELVKDVQRLLSPKEYMAFKSELSAFQRAVTEELPGVGLVPNTPDLASRNSLYQSTFSDSSKAAMERAVYAWDAPVLDEIVEGVAKELSNQKPGKPPKIGVAGFSKTAMRAIYKRLLERYQDKAIIQIVDGETTPEDVSVVQKTHNSKTKKPVITIVTSAGLYGLSLASTRSFRLPTWNSAKAGQYEGRFHRSPTQENVVTVAVADGIMQYMREVEQKKRQMETETRGAVLSVDDEDGVEVSENDLMSFLKRMNHYKPRVRKAESRSRV
jgi:hypothetical protein